MTSAVGSRGTLAGSSCIGDGGLTVGATGVAGLAAGATVSWIPEGARGVGAVGMIVKEGDEKNWGGS